MSGTALKSRYVCGVKTLEVQSGDQRICPECGKWIILHRWIRRTA